jgi:hypothetical protein
MARPSPLRHYRANLMKTKNRYNLESWEYGKWQLYGRAVETVQNSRFGKLYFNKTE